MDADGGGASGLLGLVWSGGGASVSPVLIRVLSTLSPTVTPFVFIASLQTANSQIILRDGFVRTT